MRCSGQQIVLSKAKSQWHPTGWVPLHCQEPRSFLGPFSKGEQFPIRYWHETLTLLVGTETVPDTAHLGWRGADPSRPGNDKALYVATWTNPRPEAAVTSIDLRGESGANAALFVVGISIEPPQ
jgi:hypothetical protein